MSEPAELALVTTARARAAELAIVAPDGRFTYQDLLEASQRAAQALLQGAPALSSARVAILVPPSFGYVAALYGVFRAGGIAVPLCLSHPAPELAHVLDDAQPSCIIVHAELAHVIEPLAQARGIRVLLLSTCLQAQGLLCPLPQVSPDAGALLIYTSGTTGKPKGALTTHAILHAQIRSLIEAWEIDARDRILHALPLHHLHGILNALLTPLHAGAVCEIAPRFEPLRVWERFTRAPALTLYMAVPTMYSILIGAWDNADAPTRHGFTQAASRLRLLVSGSAALPASMLERMREITGHVLLERYGMTEIGMGLGQPLHGERRPGSVGLPFPGVQARLVDDAGHVLGEEVAGHLQIRGDNVFREYWRKPEATRAVFTPDGWFITGDVAIRERGHYRLLGRQSVDILKTGGYKVSALEIEEVLREHPAIAEVCVVGVPDAQWGERVAAAVVLRDGFDDGALALEALRAWSKQRLATYKVPSLLKVVRTLPRNAMGKVQKPEAKKLWTNAP